MRSGRALLIAVVVIFLTATALPSVAATPKPGASCSKIGEKAKSGAQTLVCTKSGTHRIWVASRVTPVPNPTGTKSPVLKPTPKPTQSLPAPATDFFFVPTQLPAAVEGQLYPQFSFCRPTPANFALGACGPGTTNPRGGNPPYHFQLGTMGGFPPMGMTLGKDGQLSGTPSVGTGGRTYTFTVCAIDLSANSKCSEVQFIINVRSPFDGIYGGTFTVTYSGTALATSGQKLIGLTFTIRNGRFTGDVTGPADFSDTPNHAYGAGLKSNLLGLQCSIGNGINFTSNGTGMTYQSTLINCTDGKNDVLQGTLAGQRTGL